MSKQYTLTEEDKQELIRRVTNIGVAAFIVGVALGYGIGKLL